MTNDLNTLYKKRFQVGRKPTIDREAVLDAAEGVVSKLGAAGLTIDAVAKAAGITKGGVQSCFGNKESMIEAMIKRWDVYYQKQLAELSGHTASPDDKLKAHVVTTSQNDENNVSRSAVLLSALLQSPDYLGSVREWYAERQREFALEESDQDDTRRIAFLATEGLFFLKYFGLMALSEGEWEQNAAAIRRLLDDDEK